MNKPMQKRLAEFVNYHINGDGECNNDVLREYAERHGLSIQDRFDLSYFFSVTYCVQSSVIMFGELKEIIRGPREYAERKKEELLFQSDRKYIKMKDSFERVLVQHREIRKSAGRIIEPGKKKVRLQDAIKEVQRWDLFGRFSAFLFLETFLNMIGAETENATIEWEKGNTATSGLMNVFCYDKEADEFDKTGKINPKICTNLDRMYRYLEKRIEEAGGDSDTTKVETSLCAYRKFYKGSRYNGYYLDRMLEEINWFSKNKPKYNDFGKEILEIRAEMFNPKYLGEIGGWEGIRKELKKAYKETGVVT